MFARLHVTASSPDKSVTARFSHRDGFGVEFDKDLVAKHSDDSLARMVTSAVTGTLTGYRGALDRVAQAATSMLAGEPEDYAAERKQQYLAGSEACQDVTTTATSAGGKVRMRMRGLDRIECRIRPGTLAGNEVSLARLAVEVTSAYNQAKFQHRHAVREVAGRDIARYI